MSNIKRYFCKKENKIMTKFYRVLGFTIAVMLFMNACIKDTSPSTPAYLYIENIYFEADTTLGQGSSSAAITDVWPL